MTVENLTENVAGLAPELQGAKKGQGASPVASAGERFTSFDVEAFEVPGGREENWRFTPMRRLRGLHDGSAPLDGSAMIEIAGAGEGVTVERVSVTTSALATAASPRTGSRRRRGPRPRTSRWSPWTALPTPSRSP